MSVNEGFTVLNVMTKTKSSLDEIKFHTGKYLYVIVDELVSEHLETIRKKYGRISDDSSDGSTDQERAA